MKVIKMAAIALAATALVACSGKKEGAAKDDALKARTTEITVAAADAVTGPNADLYTISGADGAESIKVTGTPEDFNGMVEMQIDVNMVKPFGEAVHDLGPTSSFQFELLDAAGEVVYTLLLPQEDREALLAEANKPAPGTVSLKISHSISPDDYNEIFDKAKTIRLVNVELRSEAEWQNSGSGSSDEEVAGVDEGEESGDEDEESVSSSSSSSNEWDSILDDFDSYVSKMTSAIQKSNSGNASADLDYVAAQAEAASILIKLNRAKSEMTSAQQKRFSSILAKYNKALTSHK